MLTNGALPQREKLGSPDGPFHTQARYGNIVGSSHNCLQNATSKDYLSQKHTNQYHLLHWYSCSPSQQQCPGAPQLHHNSPFNMKYSSQPITSASQDFPSYGPPWQGPDFQQGSYGRSQMFPPPQSSGHGTSSPAALWVTPGPRGYTPVNGPISPSSTPPPEPRSGASRRPPITHVTNLCQTPTEPRNADLSGLVDLPTFLVICYRE